jgi:ligand-binding sensor domain-containing protein
MGKDTARRIIMAMLVGAGSILGFVCPTMAAPLSRGVHEQQPHFIRFGVEQGLSSTINDLTIDHQGYVWVATGDGLARYDGTKFRYWRRIVGDPASLPDNEVTLLHVDSADRLWAATWSAYHLEMKGRILYRNPAFCSPA